MNSANCCFNHVKDQPPAESGVARRYTAFNGGFSQDQLRWLSGQLREASESGQNVIICAHQPQHPLCARTDPVVLGWNFPDFLDVIHSEPCVRACLYGHDHDGSDGPQYDERGIAHWTLPGLLTTTPRAVDDSEQGPIDSSAILSVYDDRIEVIGGERIGSFTIPFKLSPKFDVEEP